MNFLRNITDENVKVNFGVDFGMADVPRISPWKGDPKWTYLF
jgi:hypothetical protein